MADNIEPTEATSNTEKEIQPSEPAPAAQAEITKEARNMAMLCHLLGLVGFLGPLIVWLIMKDKHKFIDEQGKEAVNYHISLIIYYAVSWILCFIFIGIFLLLALGIMHIIFVIMAAVKASNGEPFRYPIAIRFLK